MTNPDKYPKYVTTELQRYYKDGTRYVLVLDEKHEAAYMDASTIDALAASSLAVLKYRFNKGYWYGSLEDIKKPSPPEITKEIYDTLPEGSVKVEAKRVLDRHARSMRHYEDEIRFLTEAKRAIDEEDGIMAYMLLDERSDHEYERVSLEPLRTTYGR